jgi:hypothetical protein
VSRQAWYAAGVRRKRSTEMLVKAVVKLIFKAALYRALSVVLARRRKRGGRLEPRGVRRVLLSEIALMGDVVSLAPSLQAARALWPRARIDVLVPSPFAVLFECDGRVSSVLRLRDMGLASYVSALLAVRRRRYDLALSMSPGLRNAGVAALVRLMRERHDVGIAGPKMLYPDGRLQESARPFQTWARFVRRGLRVPPRAKERRAFDLLAAAREPFEADWVLGACQLVAPLRRLKCNPEAAQFIADMTEGQLGPPGRECHWRARGRLGATSGRWTCRQHSFHGVCGLRQGVRLSRR